MMDLTSFLSTTNLVIAVVTGLFAIGGAIAAWLYRKVKQTAAEANPVDLDTARRVQVIEKDLHEMGRDMKGLEGRVNEIDKLMVHVATQRDVRDLGERLASVEAGQRHTGELVQSIYQAILRAGRSET